MNSDALDCAACQDLLEACPVDDLSDDERAAVFGHCQGCPACRASLESFRVLDEQLTLACLAESGVAASRGTMGAGTRILRFSLRWGSVAAAVALAMAGGRELGVRTTRRSLLEQLVTPPAAVASSQEDSLLAPNMGFEQDHLGWRAPRSDWPDEPGSSWAGSRTGQTNFVEVDSTVAHTGNRSLKLYQRAYGGTVTRRFPVPLPPNTVLRLSFWALSPQGGTVQNKYFTAAIGCDMGPVVGVDVFDPSPVWRPYVVSLSVAQFCPEFHINFTTGAGHGNYEGWDWATWVDDVRVELSIPVTVDSWGFVGKAIRVRAHLPEGYTVAEVDPQSVVMVPSYLTRETAAGTVAGRPDSREMTLEFPDPGVLADALKKPNPFTQEKGSVGFRMKLAIPESATGQSLGIVATGGLRQP